MSAIITTAVAAGWLMYSFLTTLLSATQLNQLLLPADVLVFVVAFVLGATLVIFVWILGGLSFGVDLGDTTGFASSIGWGVVFAGINGVATIPTLFLSTGSVPSATDPRMIVSLVLLSPVGEELLYRGGIYGLINAYFPQDTFMAFTGKAMVPSFMFAVGHFWAIPLTAANFAFTFISGYVLNLSYWYTKNLGTPMVAHFTWNLIQLHLQGYF